MAERKTSQTQKTTPPAPEGFVPSQTTPDREGPADSTTEERAARLKAATEASGMEAAPEDQRAPERGDSFYNPATVGSGTILPDGTYGAPLPDPNVARLEKLAEETKDSDTSK